MNRCNQLKRILMTADTVGGVWVYALELARELNRHGLEIALATMGRRLSSDQRKEASKCRGVCVYESEFKLEWMQEPWLDVDRAGDWLLGLEAEIDPDIIHLNSYTHAALSWNAPVLVAGHSCVLSWFRAVRGTDAPREWKKYRVNVTRGLQNTDLVVAPSEAMLRVLEEHYGPFSDSRVIYNGRKSRLRKAQPKEPFIFAAGRLWDEAKNIQALAAVAAELPWPVYIAGDDKAPGNCANSCSLSTTVRHLGRLATSQISFWYARAGIYALPARYEPFGLSILEAALNGCALVLGDIPSLREIWGEDAIYVDPQRPAELISAITLLTRDHALRATLGAQARNRARQYRASTMGEQYLDAYRQIAGRRTVETVDQSTVDVGRRAFIANEAFGSV